MPQVGDTLRFSAASSLVGAGHSIVAYEWWLDSTPVAASFSGAADAAEVEIAAAAAGTLTLRLVLTDELGQRSEAQRSVTVAAAAEPVLPVALAPAAGGGGGGASSAIWVALLALAVAALLATRRRA
jgi:serine protease